MRLHSGNAGSGTPDPLEDTRSRLDAAIGAATTLGIGTGAAGAARDAIAGRQGFPGDLYVLALAGGTGVGKSSLLNALAGGDVSTAGVHRPTTTDALAWVPVARADDAAPLLDWLGGAALRTHPAPEGDPLAAVAILDLPDLDSVEPAHAARVDAVLPQVDAVLWVSDPEKYADAVLHDRYLRRWMPRLGRQAFALNKIDRLTPGDVTRLRDDLRARLGRAGATDMPILATSAVGDINALRAWLADGVAAKEIVTRRLVAAGRTAVADLVQGAGLDAATPPAPLVGDRERERATTAAAAAILRVVDLEGLREQAVAATQAAARGRGGGPLGVVRSLLDRGTGSQARSADPEGYLLRWRERGTLAPAAAPVRDLVTASLAALPATARPGLATLADTDAITARLTTATDRVIAGPAGRFGSPRSRIWPLVGVGQLMALAGVVAGVIWIVALWASGGNAPTATVELPLLGAVPTPAVLIIGGLFGAFLLGRLLRWHAARLGSSWAARLSSDISTGVRSAVSATALGPLQTWEEARTILWSAGRQDAPQT